MNHTLIRILWKRVCPFLLLGVSAHFGCSGEPSALRELAGLELDGLEPRVRDKIVALIDSVRVDPGNGESWGRLAMNLDIHRMPTPARACYNEAIARQPESFRWYYYLAILQEEREPELAAAQYRRALAQIGDYPPAWYRLSSKLADLGNWQEAAEAAGRALELDSLYYPAMLGLARAKLGAGEVGGAAVALERALAIRPDYFEAVSLLADVRRRQGDESAAEKMRRRAAALKPSATLPDPIYARLVAEGVSSHWCLIRGTVHMSRREYKQAAAEFTCAVTANPTAEAHHNLGVALKRGGERFKAIEQFRQAIRLNPEFAEPEAALGESLLSMGRADLAEKHLLRAVSLQPGLASARYSLGMLALDRGERDEAVAHFVEGLQSNPDDARLAFRLAWLRATAPDPGLRDSEEAVRLAELVDRRGRTRSPETLDVLAAAYASAGRFEEAANTANLARRAARSQRKVELAKQISERLQLYRQKKAFIQN